MDHALTLNGLDELKERLGAEAQRHWLELSRRVEDLPGRLRQKIIEAVTDRSEHMPVPATLDEREAFHTWRRLKTIATSSLSEAAKAEAQAFQSEINRAHAAAVERLYGFAVTADRVSEYVLTTHGIELSPEEQVSLVNIFGQYRQVHQDGGPSLNNTHFNAGLYAGAFGLQEMFEKIHAVEPPPPAETVKGDELRAAFTRAVRSLLDEHLARVRPAGVETCRKILTNQFHEFAYYPEAYMSWFHSINEAIKRIEAGQVAAEPTAARPSPGGFPLVKPSHPICPHCRAENHTDDELIFCTGCGRAFRREEAGPEAATTMTTTSACPGCGSTLIPGNSFCGNCGRRTV